MFKAFRYRVEPNVVQEDLFQKTFGCVRYVYNKALEDRIAHFEETGKSLSFYKQNKKLTTMKIENEWLQEPDKNALQYALIDLGEAYKKYFDGLKKGGMVGKPHFKSKHESYKSYSTANNRAEIRIEGNKIRLPKVGFVKVRISRQIPQSYVIKSATVTQEPTGKYFVSILTEYEHNPPEVEVKSAIGLDYSSPHFYVDSEGNKADMPHFYRKAQEYLAREQRRLSRMVKGSSNYHKQKIKVALAHEKIRNCRTDWQQKDSTRLANEYDLVAVESNNYEDMAHGPYLAKATYDNGFGLFRKMLAYKMAERGKKFITITKWYPSTKTCRFCGHIKPDVKLDDRSWNCPKCGAFIDRDYNAAINIRNEGLLSVT